MVFIIFFTALIEWSLRHVTERMTIVRMSFQNAKQTLFLTLGLVDHPFNTTLAVDGIFGWIIL